MSYKKDAESLLSDIQDATRDEGPLNQELERIRKSYGECIKKYQDNANDLNLAYPKIKAIMERIDLMIDEADDNIQSGIYSETKELVYKIVGSTEANSLKNTNRDSEYKRRDIEREIQIIDKCGRTCVTITVAINLN